MEFSVVLINLLEEGHGEMLLQTATETFISFSNIPRNKVTSLLNCNDVNADRILKPVIYSIQLGIQSVNSGRRPVV